MPGNVIRRIVKRGEARIKELEADLAEAHRLLKQAEAKANTAGHMADRLALREYWLCDGQTRLIEERGEARAIACRLLTERNEAQTERNKAQARVKELDDIAGRALEMAHDMSKSGTD